MKEHMTYSRDLLWSQGIEGMDERAHFEVFSCDTKLSLKRECEGCELFGYNQKTDS